MNSVEKVAEGELINHSKLVQLEKYLNSKYDFRYNVVNDRVSFKLKAEERYSSLKEYKLNSILNEVIKTGTAISQSSLRTLLYSDFSALYDPFKEYLNGLPEWDGTDYISELAKTIKTTNDEFWNIALKKWLIGLTGSLLDDKVVNQYVLIFSGAQGIGKSTWADNLVPECLKDYYYSGMINPRDKDTLIQLSQCMLINLDELENLNRQTAGSIKEIVSKGTINVRRPYGHDSEVYNRRASFIGSVNEISFLNDPTGTRRFLCFEVLEIGHKLINMDKVYAHAYHLFKQGIDYKFSMEEIGYINTYNEQFKRETAEEELVTKYFEVADNIDRADIYMNATDIADFLSKKTSYDLSKTAAINKLGKYLSIKFKTKKVKGIKKYALNFKSQVSETGDARVINMDTASAGKVG